MSPPTDGSPATSTPAPVPGAVAPDGSTATATPPQMWWTGRGRPGVIGVVWAAFWTFFLIEPLAAGWRLRDTVAGWIGMAATVAFTLWYLGFFVLWRRRRVVAAEPPSARSAVVAVGVPYLLALVMAATVGQPGSAAAVYLGVLLVLQLRGPVALAAVGLNAAAWYLAGFVVPGWTHDNGLLLAMLTAALAMFGVQQMILGNIRLRAAHVENQRLAIAEERNRFARDLHDILGHSLTVITVKAELARRLVDVDPERARSELADLEQLSRDALADVRRAVDGYRELTLPGEIARARAALEAAAIEADLPNATDQVPGVLRELFAWTIREGVTNVIRHSGASRCTVRLRPDAVEVLDDGRGPRGPSTAGHGLTGLHERAQRLGATVVATSGEPHGFALRVTATAPDATEAAR